MARLIFLDAEGAPYDFSERDMLPRERQAHDLLESIDRFERAAQFSSNRVFWLSGKCARLQ